RQHELRAAAGQGRPEDDRRQGRARGADLEPQAVPAAHAARAVGRSAPARRGQTRIEIARLHRDLGATTIYVTHDQVEAMTLADRVVVLRDGRIEQVGTPLQLYDKPANQFVAQ